MQTLTKAFIVIFALGLLVYFVFLQLISPTESHAKPWSPPEVVNPENVIGLWEGINRHYRTVEVIRIRSNNIAYLIAKTPVGSFRYVSDPIEFNGGYMKISFRNREKKIFTLRAVRPLWFFNESIALRYFTPGGSIENHGHTCGTDLIFYHSVPERQNRWDLLYERLKRSRALLMEAD